MTDSLRTLVVDDEEQIRFFLKETLQRAGHVVTTASSGEEALELLQDTSFDVVLLDLMLGGRIHGQRVLEAVKWRWPSTVVVMLTAHGSLESALAAIQEGVDGYLLKPVRPREVREAIRIAIERQGQRVPVATEEAEQRFLVRGRFSLDLQKYLATLDGQPLDLTSSEFKLLSHLMQNANCPISAAQLVEAVRDYRPDHTHEARQVVKWYIHRLRQKIEKDPSNPRHIVSVRGVGYMFEDKEERR